ncbi:CBS domain-containing protein [Polymorphospora sp. NPDC051019]|uniref:CBS domain-containing protein n=1 Tax=Polymorphospora sp. NPDC051019 TaxID=3155725 RepID=UPI0034401CEE
MRTWTVDDVMTTDVLTVGESAPYREIVDLMTGRRVSAVPVVDEFRRVLGVISEADLLHKVELTGESPGWRIFEGRRRHDARVKAAGMIAYELMTTPAVTVPAGTPLAAAARRMSRENVKRLPVTDDLGRLVGIVSRSDLLKVHLRPDGDIQRDIVREVVERVLTAQEGTLEVTVTDGMVELAGRLDRRSSAEIAGRLAARVPGVVDVVADDLTYDFDDVDPAPSTSAAAG